MLAELEKNSITPIATLFHWDTPLALMHRYGGWEDIGDQMVTDFVTYAETAFRRFGNKVTKWVTFNEPRESLVSTD